MTPSFLAVDGADHRVRAVPISRRKLPAAVLLAVLACLLLPLHASAHAYLVVSTPRSGQRLPTAPSGLQLLFTQPVALAHSGVQIFTERFELVPGTVARVSPAGASIAVSLPPLPNGDYAAIWTVISADDGHLTDGTIAFSVGPAPPAGSAAAHVIAIPGTGRGAGDTEQPRDWPGTAATWLLLLGLALAGGGLAAERALSGPGEVRGGLRLTGRYLSVAMAIALLGSLLAFVATAGRLHDGGTLSGLDPRTWSAAWGVRVGLEDLASVALILNALGALILLRDRLVCLGSVIGAMVLVGMRSHPAGASGWGEAAIIIHVVVALTWGGSLAHLVTMLRRRRSPASGDLDGALGRYARLALLSVLAIVLTGGAATLTQIGSPAELLGTTYGRLLTLKVAVVAWTMLVATVGRWRGLRGGLADAAAVGDVLGAEVIGLLLVLLTTAALANVAPPAPVVSSTGEVAAGGVATVLLLLLGAAMTGAMALATVPMLRRPARAV